MKTKDTFPNNAGGLKTAGPNRSCPSRSSRVGTGHISMGERSLLKPPRTRFWRSSLFFAPLTSVLIMAGCATQDAQKSVERVAKDWCNTIRASQIVPVYPLTADLTVGDVFLAQTTLSAQADQYRSRGFLPLDDHRYRLPITNFSSVYFNGYWTNSYGDTPHQLPVLPPSSATNSNATNTFAEAPRVMFPTFTFQAQSSSGLSAAFPVEGVPVGLNYLRSDKVAGSLSISDARTYAADEAELRKALDKWATMTEVKEMLSKTAKGALPNAVYLRVISRVYLARAMQVSLSKEIQEKGGAKAGNTPDFALLGVSTNPEAQLNATSTNGISGLSLAPLLAAATNLLNLADAGGGVKYARVGQSSVTLNQVFDQLLAVGYLGFDLPVFEDGTLGVAVPTFQRLKGNITGWLRPLLEARGNMNTLKALIDLNPTKAVMLMSNVTAALNGNNGDEFRLTSEMLNGLEGKQLISTNRADMKQVHAVFKHFRASTRSFLARPYLLKRWPFNNVPIRIEQLNSVFARAWSRMREESPDAVNR